MIGTQILNRPLKEDEIVPAIDSWMLINGVWYKIKSIYLSCEDNVIVEVRRV